MEAVGVFFAKVGINAANGKVHLGQPPCGVIGFLTINGDVSDSSTVFFDKLFRLDEHATRATAGVIDTAFVWREHFDQQAHDAARRVELAALLAFGAGKLREEIFINAAKDILGAVSLVAQTDVADEVYELAEALFIEARVGVVFGKDASANS